jgi:hypothetical protein
MEGIERQGTSNSTRNEQLLFRLKSELLGKEVQVKEITSYDKKYKLPWVLTKIQGSVGLGSPVVFENGVTTKKVTNIKFEYGVWTIQTEDSVFELRLPKETTKK